MAVTMGSAVMYAAITAVSGHWSDSLGRAGIRIGYIDKLWWFAHEMDFLWAFLFQEKAREWNEAEVHRTAVKGEMRCHRLL